MKDMEDFTLGATDGIIGRVNDFYFDDEAWVIRYLVAGGGEGSSRHQVLISPISIGRPNWSQKIFPVSLTRAQIQGSPDIDTRKPVSRQHEMGYLGYYGYGNYWSGGGLWGAGIHPDELRAGSQAKDGAVRGDDVHLRSGNEIMRYYVRATDGDIGHVQGLIVDEKSWAIRYVIVNTSNWRLGHQVIIAPEWIDDVDWAESTLSIDLSRQAIRNFPPYDPTAPCCSPPTSVGKSAGARNRKFSTMTSPTLAPDMLRKIDVYWRAANYVSVGQINLYDNPLLKR